MRKGKRYFSLILAGLLAVSLLAGCGGQEKKDKNTLTGDCGGSSNVRSSCGVDRFCGQ